MPQPESAVVIDAHLNKIDQKPYNPEARLALSRCYQDAGFPDLAASEAYMALLLVDEIQDEYGEYHEQATEATQELFADARGNQPESQMLVFAKLHIELPSYLLLCNNLLSCNCLRSAKEFVDRAVGKHPDNDELISLKEAIENAIMKCMKTDHLESISHQDIPDHGLVRRVLYPWNNREPDRFSGNCLEYLNARLHAVAPNLSVNAVELPDLRSGQDGSTMRQLGVFADFDLAPGETILDEKSLLTGTSRLNDEFCDACSIALSNDLTASVACPECAETIFCGQECLDLAQEAYHPALCGMDISSISKDAPAAEAADALYSLLLLRTFAMAVTQETHPLDLPEVKYIWGDFNNETPYEQASGIPDPFLGHPRRLPFSFHCNILLPIHILEKLDQNIFTTSRFSTWITNTLYAKFRGTASARQGATGLPEVGAVHPMWCLANHSCDPNVAWEWNGGMKFWVREERIKWDSKDDIKQPGIKAGEEIVSHYCDVTLPVKERREWAEGALGGLCCCERCSWESSL